VVIRRRPRNVYHDDGLGWVRGVTAGNGDLVASYVTDEFGIDIAGVRPALGGAKVSAHG